MVDHISELCRDSGVVAGKAPNLATVPVVDSTPTVTLLATGTGKEGLEGQEKEKDGFGLEKKEWGG